MTPERLAEIRERAKRCEVVPDHPGSMFSWQDSAKDVPALLAELEKVRAHRDYLSQRLDKRTKEASGRKQHGDRLRAELARWEGHDAVTATLVKQAENERDRARTVAANAEKTLGEQIDRAVAAEAERDRLAEQVKRVREQHSARRIYGECGHRHEKPDADLGVKEVRSVGLVCEDGYDYTVCRACCCDPDGDQSRECAENHDRECWPCPTIRVLDGSEAGR